MVFENSVKIANILSLQKSIEKSIINLKPCSVIGMMFDIDESNKIYLMLYSIKRLVDVSIFLPIGINSFIMATETSLEQTILFSKMIQKYLKSKYNYDIPAMSVTFFEKTNNYIDNAENLIARCNNLLIQSQKAQTMVYGTKTYNSLQDINVVEIFRHLHSVDKNISIVHFNETQDNYIKISATIKQINQNNIIVIETSIEEFIYLKKNNITDLILKDDYIVGKIFAKVDIFDTDRLEIVCKIEKVDNSSLFRRKDKRIKLEDETMVHIANLKNDKIVATGKILDFSKISIAISIDEENIKELIDRLKQLDLYVQFEMRDRNVSIVADFYTFTQREGNNILILFLFPTKEAKEYFDDLYNDQNENMLKQVKKYIAEYC